MKVLLNAEEMRICDEKAISMASSPDLFMRRAGKAVFDKAVSDFNPQRTLCVCGGGNNGGDGIIAAMLLYESGYDVDIYLAFGEKQGTADLIAEARKKCVNFVTDPIFDSYTLIIDALFGVGLTRSVIGSAYDDISAINDSGVDVLSVDIPSGVYSDSGKIAGISVKATETVTMQTYKKGQALSDGINMCGKISVADLDIGVAAYMNGAEPLVICREDLTSIPKRERTSNKGTFGRVLVIAGSVGMSGAAFLSSKAAYRSGAGIVEVFTPNENRTVLQTLIPEAIVTSYDVYDFDTELLTNALNRATVVIIGPGLGKSEASRFIVKEVYENVSSPLIVDADALNITAEEGLSYPTDVPVIVTPHPGELSRLTGKSILQLLEYPIDEAVDYSVENDIICVAKSARTVIADGNKVYVNMSGGASLAKGGSGDVLTGVIAGMLCADLAPVEAAAFGVYIHGAAGDITAEQMGEFSPMATDVIEAISTVLKDIR